MRRATARGMQAPHSAAFPRRADALGTDVDEYRPADHAVDRGEQTPACQEAPPPSITGGGHLWRRYGLSGVQATRNTEFDGAHGTLPTAARPARPPRVPASRAHAHSEPPTGECREGQ